MAGLVIAHLKSIFEMESLGADTLQSDLKKIQGAMDPGQVNTLASKLTDLGREYQKLSDTAKSSSGVFGKQFQNEALTTAASMRNLVTQAAELSSAMSKAQFGRNVGLGAFVSGGLGAIAGTVIGGPVGGALAGAGALAGVPGAIMAIINKNLIEGLKPALDKLVNEVVPRGSSSRAIGNANAVSSNVGLGMSDALRMAKMATDVMAKMPDLAEIEKYNAGVIGIGKSWNIARLAVSNIQTDMRTLNATATTLAGLIYGIAEQLKSSAGTLATMTAAAGGGRTGKEAMSVRNAAQVEAEKMIATAAKERLETELAAKSKLAAAEAAKVAAQAYKVEAEAANILRAAQAQAAQAATAQAAANTASMASGSAAAQGFASSVGSVAGKVKGLWAGLSSLRQKVQEVSESTQAMGSGWNGLLATMGKLGAASAITTGPIASLLGRMWALSYAIESVGVKAVAAVGGLSSLIGGAVGIKNAVVNVAMHLEGVRIGLEKFASDGGASWRELTGLAMRYGASVGDMAKPYQRLLVAAQTSDIMGSKFTGMIDNITATVSALGLAKEDVSGVMRAFEQMLSKGVVRAEEFSQQLGDHLPAAAKVGLLTFRQMTGDVNASMLDFFNALHKGTIGASEFIPAYTKNYREMVIGVNSGNETLSGSVNRMSTAWDKMIIAVDTAINVTGILKAAYNSVSVTLEGVGANINVLAGLISGLATAITTRLAAPYVVASITSVGSALTTGFALITSGQLGASMVALTANLVPLLARLGLIAAAATAVGLAVYSMTSSAKADPLNGVTESIARANKALDSFVAKSDTASSAALDRSRNELGAKMAELEGLRKSLEDLRDAKKKLINSDGETGAKYIEGAPDEVRKLTAQISELDTKIVQLRGKYEELNAAAVDVFKAPNAGVQEAIKSQEELSKKVLEYQNYINDLATYGVQAARAQREINTSMSQFNMLTNDKSARAAYLSDLTKLQALKQRAAALEKEEKPEKALQTDLEQYKNIIQRAQDLIDGVSGSDANKMAKMRKDLDEYAEAMRRLGTAEELIAPKVAQLREAFEMQASGINMATLTFKPFMALQRGLESMSDSFADLAVSGKLSFESLGSMVKQTTLSIIKDLISMTIKVGIVKPILQSAFGSMGNGGSGVSAGLFSGMFGMADGGVVNSPTYFPIGNGSVAKTGEMGPEAVLPLSRGSDGTLGVTLNGGGGGGGNNGNSGNTYHVTYAIDARGAQAGVGDQIATALRSYDESLPARLADINKRV